MNCSDRLLASVISGIFFCNLAFAKEASSEKPASGDTADAHVHGSHIECPLPNAAIEVIRCAQEEHPKVLRAKLALSQAHGLSEVAKQLKNPELDVESVAGRINGEKQSESKVAVLIPVEIGGKRSARKVEAESRARNSGAELSDIQSEVVIETALSLHRLRQIEQEKSILQEAIKTFSQVVSQQRSRPGLSPEQKVSVSVFRMALSEAKIRQSELQEEEKSLEHYFHLSTGHSLNELKKILPSAPKIWPALKSSSDVSRSPNMLRSKAELELAIAQLKAARAESWPELKVGPMVQFQEDGPDRGSIFGFQLSMGLPFFSLNQGGRNFAKLGESRASKIVDLTRVEEIHEREEQAQNYERAVQILKDTPTIQELERDHKQHESFAKRGLISASLIIECHRQIEELTRSRHSRELKALESLWQVYKFDGRILTEAL